MTGLETVAIGHADAGGFHITSRIRKGDVLLAFAFSRYTRATRQLVEHARGREATTMVICDTVMAPACSTADCVLQAATRSASFHHSYAGAVACVNALVAAISTKARTRVARRLREVAAHLPPGHFEV
jgi:DNA-binding MurR/RpiR family transcriptional regulator